jgi:hypothetical protein
MVRPSSFAAALLALAYSANAQCGSGTPDATVTGSGSSFKASKGSNAVYTGSDYRAAIQAALDSISSGQRVAVIASGSIGANTITISSGKIFEGCGTINVANRAGHGAIESLGTTGVQIPYLSMSMCLWCFRFLLLEYRRRAEKLFGISEVYPLL